MLYSTFRLMDALMAVPIPCILEIGRSFTFHPVRGAPDVIDGLINLRGKVVTVINTGLPSDLLAVYRDLISYALILQSLRLRYLLRNLLSSELLCSMFLTCQEAVAISNNCPNK